MKNRYKDNYRFFNMQLFCGSFLKTFYKTEKPLKSGFSVQIIFRRFNMTTSLARS
jgi:hypothetical protein